MGTDQTVELSDAGYQFLIDLFNSHDKVCKLFTGKGCLEMHPPPPPPHLLSLITFDQAVNKSTKHYFTLFLKAHSVHLPPPPPNLYTLMLMM